MDDSELRRRRSLRIVPARTVLVLYGAVERARQLLLHALEVPIVRSLAVRAPVPFVRARVRVEHDDAVVHVPVGRTRRPERLGLADGAAAAEVALERIRAGFNGEETENMSDLERLF
jgi:hypothetical protein